MAYFGFTDKLRAGKTIQIFNYGHCERDFTYIDDIVEGIIRVMQGAPEKKNGEDGLPIPPYAVYNIGGGRPENLLQFVDILQQELIRAGVLPKDYDFEAHKKLVPMQAGDVPVTYADTEALEKDYAIALPPPFAKASGNLRNGTRPTIISDTKSGTLPEGPLFEIRDLSSEGRHSDGRYQTPDDGSEALLLVISSGEK